MKKTSTSFKVTGAYIASSLLWITLSDSVIYRLTSEPSATTKLQTMKGYLYVMLSSALIYFVLNNIEIRFENIISTLKLKNQALRHDNEVLSMQLDFKDCRTKELEHFATMDELTGINNRRSGLELFRSQLEAAKEKKSNLLVSFIDIDGLKSINDRFGHHEGDILISTVARILNNSIRKKDILCRLGGDEFLIVFPEASSKDISSIKNKINTAISNYNQHSDKTYAISCSIGFSEYRYSENRGVDELINSADMKMYEEKRIHKLNFARYNELMYS